MDCKKEILDKLKEASLKITPKRMALIDVLLKENQFLTIKDIHKEIKKIIPHINLTTVYRNIEIFEEKEIIFKANINMREAGYALCKAGNSRHHHHIVCNKCGIFSSLYCCNFEQIEEELSRTTGFSDIKHKIEFEGTCPSCKEKEKYKKHLKLFMIKKSG